MKLIEWISQTKIKINDIARILDINRNHLYMIRRGIKKPSRRLVQAVYDMTLGHVNGVDDFRDEMCLRHKVQKRLLNETKASMAPHPQDE